MWYKCENASADKPAAVDSTSSKKYVYLRKDIKYVLARDDIPAHYEWLEKKVARDEWTLTAIEDIFTALTELAEMIAG